MVSQKEVLCCQQTRSSGEYWGGVWVWLEGSGRRVEIGCLSNLHSLDLYLRLQQRGRTASAAPWQRHRSEGTGPGRQAWS